MKLAAIALVMLTACSARIDAHNYHSTVFPGGPQAAIVIEQSLPDSDMLPEQSAPVPGSNFVMLQSKGGSILFIPLEPLTERTAAVLAAADPVSSQAAS
jgi:hypothetical protein